MFSRLAADKVCGDYRVMLELSGTNAVLLVGGMGTRLRPVVGNIPKPMAKVLGRPFLCFILDQLADAGIRKVVLCTGYLGELVKSNLGPSYRSIELTYSQESSPLDTAGALRLAASLVESDEVLVVNGDSFCETDFPAFFNWFKSKNADSGIMICRVPDASRYGMVEFDDHGLVLSFREKGAHIGAGWINSGIYLLSRRLVLDIPCPGPVSMEREVLPLLVAQRRLYSYRNYGRFLDIGTPESYAVAGDFFLAMECSR